MEFSGILVLRNSIEFYGINSNFEFPIIDDTRKSMKLAN